MKNINLNAIKLAKLYIQADMPIEIIFKMARQQKISKSSVKRHIVNCIFVVRWNLINDGTTSDISKLLDNLYYKKLIPFSYKKHYSRFTFIYCYNENCYTDFLEKHSHLY